MGMSGSDYDTIAWALVFFVVVIISLVGLFVLRAVQRSRSLLDGLAKNVEILKQSAAIVSSHYYPADDALSPVRSPNSPKRRTSVSSLHQDVVWAAPKLVEQFPVMTEDGREIGMSKDNVEWGLMHPVVKQVIKINGHRFNLDKTSLVDADHVMDLFDYDKSGLIPTRLFLWGLGIDDPSVAEEVEEVELPYTEKLLLLFPAVTPDGQFETEMTQEQVARALVDPQVMEVMSRFGHRFNAKGVGAVDVDDVMLLFDVEKKGLIPTRMFLWGLGVDNPPTAKTGKMKEPTVRDKKEPIIKDFKNLLRTFQTMDIDGDGSVNAAEFEAVLEEPGFQRVLLETGMDAKSLLEKLDENGDGNISVMEFLGGMGSLVDQLGLQDEAKELAVHLEVKRKEPLIKDANSLFAVFHGMDVDGDGSVTTAELAEALSEPTFHKIIHESGLDVEQLMKRLDSNNDGLVSVMEFLNGFSKLIQELGLEENIVTLSEQIEKKAKKAKKYAYRRSLAPMDETIRRSIQKGSIKSMIQNFQSGDTNAGATATVSVKSAVTNYATPTPPASTSVKWRGKTQPARAAGKETPSGRPAPIVGMKRPSIGRPNNSAGGRPVLFDESDEESEEFGFDSANDNIQEEQAKAARVLQEEQAKAARVLQEEEEAKAAKVLQEEQKVAKALLEKERETAATKVQAGFRGYKARKEMTEKTKAATRIQASFRGHMSRKKGHLIEGFDGLIKAFEMIDIDGDGKVSKFELQRTLEAGGKSILSNISFPDLMEHLDVDHDGAVSANEFLQGMQQVLSQLGIEGQGETLAAAIKKKQMESAAAQREAERIQVEKLEKALFLKRQAAKMKSDQRAEAAAKKREEQAAKEAAEREKREAEKARVQSAFAAFQ